MEKVRKSINVCFPKHFQISWENGRSGKIFLLLIDLVMSVGELKESERFYKIVSSKVDFKSFDNNLRNRLNQIEGR